MFEQIRPSQIFNLRILVIALWAVLASVALYLFFFHREATQKELSDLMSASLWMAGVVYFVLNVLRGFIFLPAFPLVILGIAFFPPIPLFVLTLAGILIPAAVIYRFPSAFPFRDSLGARYDGIMEKVDYWLKRSELPVLIVWSFLPFTPTNVIVWVSGLLALKFWKVMLGVAIGSGANCALYIFLGDYLLRVSGWK
jgi:uncharacterized membrane protein YdjX (TVP38/TMEM64 family)